MCDSLSLISSVLIGPLAWMLGFSPIPLKNRLHYRCKLWSTFLPGAVRLLDVKDIKKSSILACFGLVWHCFKCTFYFEHGYLCCGMELSFDKIIHFNVLFYNIWWNFKQFGPFDLYFFSFIESKNWNNYL